MEKKILPVELDFNIKTYDIDFAGVVSNIVYIRWLEDLRCLWLERYFPLRDQMKSGYAPAVASTDIQYRCPVRMFSAVKGGMWVRKISMIKYTLEAEFYSDGHLSATACQVGCFVGLKDLKPIRMPKRLTELFQTHS